MKRTPRQKVNSVLNLLHKGFVLTCFGVTLYGTSLLGYRFIRYTMVTAPEYKEKRKLEEQSLLAEGSSNNLKDPAPTIS